MFILGKARRLKQAKEEAQDEIEKYRQERERQFREFEAKVSTFDKRKLFLKFNILNRNIPKVQKNTTLRIIFSFYRLAHGIERRCCYTYRG